MTTLTDPTTTPPAPGRTPPTMTAPTDTETVTSAAVRAALVELLTTGQHHHAATPATLAAVGEARRALAEHYGTADPAAHFAPDTRRLAALTRALGTVGAALIVALHPPQPGTTGLHPGLAELAAVALGWLDALPDPPPSDPDNDMPF